MPTVFVNGLGGIGELSIPAKVLEVEAALLKATDIEMKVCPGDSIPYRALRKENEEGPPRYDPNFIAVIRIEVDWYKRPSEIKDKVAKVLDKRFGHLGRTHITFTDRDHGTIYVDGELAGPAPTEATS